MSVEPDGGPCTCRDEDQPAFKLGYQRGLAERDAEIAQLRAALDAAEAKLATAVEQGNRLAVVVRAYFDEDSAVGGVELLAAIDEYAPAQVTLRALGIDPSKEQGK